LSEAKDPPDFILELRARVDPWVTEVLGRSAELGFLGGMPAADQIDHALGFVQSAESALKGPPGSVIDLGSGGGVPGLVLMSCWPESRFALIDSSERRTDFLLLETDRWAHQGEVEVIRGRAEELARSERLRQQFELVTSRSFGLPGVTAECGAPFLSLGGTMVVSEPPDGSEIIRWPAEGLAKVGLEDLGQVRFDGRFGYQVLRKSTVTPERYPRRVGIPSKRPLF
jgi:16S rRNA (guanine527-N7)-methyltransferase